MTERIWDLLLTQQGKAVFAQVGMGQQSGGVRHHALLAMEANYNFTGDKPYPILETVKRDIAAIPEIVIDCFGRYQCASILPSLAR